MGARTRGFANNVLTSGKLDATDGLTGNLASTNFANATVTNIEELPPAVGSAISSVAGNPAAPVAVGKIWYNTNTDSFNIAASLAAWSSGSNMSTPRRDPAGFGTQTASVAAAGHGASTYITATEEYNGSGWSTGTTYPGGVASMGSTGTSTAGLVFGASGPGTPNTATYDYDGSTWTAGGNLGSGRYDMGGAGTQTAALSYGGSVTTNVESYNGTAWTSTTALNTARRGPASVGTQTAALAAGGKFSPNPTDITANVEEWNGSSWTEVNNLPAPTFLMGSAGIQTDALVFGGSQGAPLLATTAAYDGTNWSSKPNMSTARDRMGSGQYASPSSAALAFAGNSPSPSGTTEEYNSSLNVITAAAWASGGALNNARRQVTGAGLQTAALSAGGYNDTATMNNTEEYDGTSWTNSPTMPEGKRLSATFGTQTAAIDATGIGSSTYSTTTQSYDGSTWTSGLGAVNTGRYSNNCFGTSTAALINGGQAAPGFTNASEEWNGTSWTAGTASSDTKYAGYHSGTQTAGLIAGGFAPPASNSTEEWNGSSWTSGGNLLYTAYAGNASNNGTQTSTIVFAGIVNGSPDSGITQGYDGSAWSTRPSLGTGRASPGGAGTANSALAFGGGPGAITTTEEFTGETSALNVESLTTS